MKSPSDPVENIQNETDSPAAKLPSMKSILQEFEQVITDTNSEVHKLQL